MYVFLYTLYINWLAHGKNCHLLDAWVTICTDSNYSMLEHSYTNWYQTFKIWPSCIFLPVMKFCPSSVFVCILPTARLWQLESLWRAPPNLQMSGIVFCSLFPWISQSVKHFLIFLIIPDFSWFLNNSWFFPEFRVKTPDNSWFSTFYP